VHSVSACTWATCSWLAPHLLDQLGPAGLFAGEPAGVAGVLEAPEGGIDLPTIQRYLNFWFSVSLDLFGGEISSNAASFFDFQYVRHEG
jgi:hypothetical protein